MASTRILMLGSTYYSSNVDNQRARTMDPTTQNQTHPTSFSTKAKMRTARLLLARASNPKSEGQEEDNNNSAFSSPEDLNYLWKLGVGSFGGAAVIKYGSILFPQITKPNITEALIMILIPVLVAVFLLIKQSRAEGQSKDSF